MDTDILKESTFLGRRMFPGIYSKSISVVRASGRKPKSRLSILSYIFFPLNGKKMSTLDSKNMQI